jgi:pseudouridine-5'-phosphate glycosidase
LTELAKTPVSVISAGVKSILDIPKTLEYLETMGVPVTTYGNDYFPDFFTSNSGIKTEFRCDTPEECAGMIHAQKAIGLKTGMIFANPVPKDKEADPVQIKKAIEQANKEC